MRGGVLTTPKSYLESIVKDAALLRPLTLGTLRLEHNVLLAPMAGVTDLPFRLLCREQGAAFAYTEMISAKGVHYKSVHRSKTPRHCLHKQRLWIPTSKVRLARNSASIAE